MTNLPAGKTRVFVIAEIASCHGGKRAAMSEAIRVANAAGADAVKFQWTSSPERLAARRHAEDYLWAYRTLAFPQEWLAELKAECDAAGIEFLCTVFLPEDIPVIAPLVKRFKIASFEAGDKAFRHAHLRYRKPILISTGGMTLNELGALEDWRGESEWYTGKRRNISLLHCTAAYPAPPEALHLDAIGGTEAYTLEGFSDHSANVVTGALAVMAGAEIVEVHVRLARTSRANPDYRHSLTPSQLAQYVTNIRFAEQAKGNPWKRIQPSEKRWLRYRVRS